MPLCAEHKACPAEDNVLESWLNVDLGMDK